MKFLYTRLTMLTLCALLFVEGNAMAPEEKSSSDENIQTISLTHTLKVRLYKALEKAIDLQDASKLEFLLNKQSTLENVVWVISGALLVANYQSNDIMKGIVKVILDYAKAEPKTLHEILTTRTENECKYNLLDITILKKFPKTTKMILDYAKAEPKTLHEMLTSKGYNDATILINIIQCIPESEDIVEMILDYAKAEPKTLHEMLIPHHHNYGSPRIAKSALYYAIKENRPEIARMIVEYSSYAGNTTFHQVVGYEMYTTCKNEETVFDLLEKSDFDKIKSIKELIVKHAFKHRVPKSMGHAFPWMKNLSNRRLNI